MLRPCIASRLRRASTQSNGLHSARCFGRRLRFLDRQPEIGRDLGSRREAFRRPAHARLRAGIKHRREPSALALGNPGGPFTLSPPCLERRGGKIIACNIRKGALRDAILFSCGANSAHGQRRTNRDKRRAVETLLHDEEWSKLGDRKIADICAVSHPFVMQVRAEVVTVTTCDPPTKRLGRDGKQYPATRNSARQNGTRAVARESDIDAIDHVAAANGRNKKDEPNVIGHYRDCLDETTPNE